MATDSFTQPEDGYSIGVVARLTGINPETLRIWERRYSMAAPARAGARKTRRYSAEDVRRLKLVKSLVDGGHPISTVAHLPIEQLESRLGRVNPGQRPQSTAARVGARVVVLGESISARSRGDDFVIAGFEVVGAFDSPAEFEQQAQALQPDMAILEYASLQADALPQIRRQLERGGVAHGVVIYGFAARATLEALDVAGIVAIQQPASLAAIQRACELAIGAHSVVPQGSATESPGIAQRRFTTEQLMQIAQSAPSVRCECPHHMVDLISKLLDFEKYSSECASMNEQDREIHRMLQQRTASARTMLEGALAELIRFEGIALA